MLRSINNKKKVMKNLRAYIVWTSMFMIVAGFNFCTHKLSYNKSEFGYAVITNTSTKKIVYSNFNMDIPGFNPMPVTWETLKEVKYEMKFNNQYQIKIQYPVFSNNVKQLKGKELYISGYMIPFDVHQGIFAISRNPYSSCFFCGKSGPESVMSVEFKDKPKKYRVDAYATIKGTLFLNDTNPMDFFYILKNAEEIDEPRD